MHDDDFSRRLAEFTERTWGDMSGADDGMVESSDGLQLRAYLQGRAAAGAHPLRIAEQTLAGCIETLLALEGAVPAEKMPAEALPLINACGTVLSLARSEIDTILKAEALAYAAGGPDAA